MAYMGFKALTDKLAKQRKVRNPRALAASIGRKKYGKKPFQRAASTSNSMKGLQAAAKR